MTMPDAPVLSLESVNALIPRLSIVVGEQLARRSKIEVKLAALTTLLGAAPDDLDATEGDTAEVSRLRAEAKELIVAYRTGWRELEEMGAVLKDPRSGLVDFYGHVEGQLVWLCWKYGETEVTHYHGLEDGFTARKAIAEAAKLRLLN
jgi:hypothetical protein